MTTTGHQPRPSALPDLSRLPLFAVPDAAADSVPPPVQSMPPAAPRLARRSRDRGAASRSVPADRPDLDWAQVRSLRGAAAKLLAEALRDRSAVDAAEERALGTQIVADLVRNQAAADNAAGQRTDRVMLTRLGEAVLDALFGLGRLQPLVDNPQLENIEIYGCDHTVLVWADGNCTFGPPIADSDEELIEELAFLATRGEASQRTFSPASPLLNLRLDGGARLAAYAWVSRRPTAVIRLHRLVRVSLADLVGLGMMSPEVHDVLARAMRRRLTIVVAGAMGAGKTTLLRALAGEIDPWEAVGTIETEFELHLDQQRDRYHRIHAVEMRPGHGERLADGTIAGEVTVAELTYNSWRWNLDRVILGEVRGPEVLEMFNIMGGGGGGLCTVHAKDAHGAIQRMVTLAMRAGPQISADYAQREVGQHVDLIVHVGSARTKAGRHRFVSQILFVEHTGDGLATTVLYQAGPDRVARLRHMPQHLAVELGL